MSKKRYTSGEIASSAGLTIRAVQHYDNIGLLPSSGRTEEGVAIIQRTIAICIDFERFSEPFAYLHNRNNPAQDVIGAETHVRY
ncbi:hypothetical protein HNQ56_000083 [Anaerotaenia torta]|uniref:MerR family DNA-binding transcriptional regulator n=1 Tax=Anaerotaenia torta TaxID=433293 RepID=UPI003D2114AD